MSHKNLLPDFVVPESITCADTTYLVSIGRDEPLDTLQVVNLDWHIKSCGYCQIAFQQFQAMFSQLEIVLARPKDT
jgi:hypothetical protein